MAEKKKKPIQEILNPPIPSPLREVLLPQSKPFPNITIPEEKKTQVLREGTGVIDETGKLVSGAPSGVILPDGRMLLGVNPADVEKISKAEEAKTALPEGAVEASDVAAKKEQIRKGIILSEQVGDIDVNQPIATSPDVSQAVGAGLTAIAPEAARFAAAGAGIGLLGGPAAPVTVPAGAAIGATAGAIGGFLSGFISNLRGQLGGELTAKGQSVTKAERNLRALITDTNQNPANAINNLAAFNQQLALVETEYGDLKLETSRSLNKWLSKDGTEQLQRYELFYSSGGSRDFLIREMQVALLNPNPSKNFMLLEDFTEE